MFFSACIAIFAAFVSVLLPSHKTVAAAVAPGSSPKYNVGVEGQSSSAHKLFQFVCLCVPRFLGVGVAPK